MTFSSLSCLHCFQLGKKLLEVRLLGRYGEYFRGHVNGINGRAGLCKSGVGIVWEWVFRLLLLLFRWMGGYMKRGTEWGFGWKKFGI